MAESLNQKVKKVLRDKKNYKRYIAVLLCLSLIVGFGTVTVLHKEGEAATHQKKVLDCSYVAPTGDGYAGYCAHVHNDDCYDKNGQLVCQLPEIQAHYHTDACWATEKELVCGLEENAGHVHTDACYATGEELICGQEETAGHAHGHDCYAWDTGLICGQDEYPAHWHDDSCYSWSSELSCGQDEYPAHWHDDSCYDWYTDLICGQEEGEDHTHSDSCYGPVRGGLICGMVEGPGHTHDDSCWTSVRGDLICGMAEGPGHTHDASCYGEVQGELLCQIPECEPHTHTEACHPQAGDLICGKQEGEGAHTHDDSCYREVKKCVCGMEGIHIHTGDCYDAGGNLVCGQLQLELHVHNENCFKMVDMTPEEIAALNEEVKYDVGAEDSTWLCAGDPNADVEIWNDWVDMFADVEFSGDWAEDVLMLAKMQLGYSESTANFARSEKNEIKGYTRYGAWYGIPYGDWCAMFASFCIRWAGIPEDAMPVDCSCQNWVKNLTEEEMFASAEYYIPNPGDLVFYDFNEDGIADHVGFVVSIDPENNTLVTLEGNRTDTVEIFTLRLNEACVMGYGLVPTNPDPDGTAVSYYPEQNFEDTVGDVTVTVYAPEGAFPEGTRMELSLVEDEEILNAAAAAVQSENVGETRAVDITFYYGEEKIEPKLPIRVTMSSDVVGAAKDSAVVHIDDTGAAQVVENAESKDNDLSFSSDSFSVYVIVGLESITTQYLTADGETYLITLTYGPEAMIPEGAALQVREIVGELPETGAEESASEYADYLAKTENALEKNEKLTFARFFDITIMADGVEVQPAAPVDVKIALAEEVTGEGVRAVHFVTAEEDPAVADAVLLNAARVDPENMHDAVSFAADGFSVYGVLGVGTITTKYITAGGETYTITVSYEKEAEIPDGATLEVREIRNGQDGYTGYVEQAAAAMTVEGEELPFVNAARLFDIRIMSGGEKVEPKAPVSVKIEYASAEILSGTSQVGTVHFREEMEKTGELSDPENPDVLPAEDGTPALRAEVLNADVLGSAEQMEGVAFTTDSFSVYAVIIIDREAGSFVAEGENYRITVSYTKEANIPIGTELIVEEIDPSSSQYAELWKKTIDKLNEGVEWTNPDEPDPRKGLTDAAFFDITLKYDGRKIEPDVPLKVKIEYKEGGILTPSGEDALVVHFGDRGTELITGVQTETETPDMPYLTGVLRGSSMTTAFDYDQNGFSVVGSGSTGEYVEITPNNISGPPLQLMAAPSRDASIAAAKTVTDADGDGVYELALSVTGSSESSSTTAVDKSNVVIVVDVSGSMDTYVYTPYTYSADTYSSDTTYYRGTGQNPGTCYYWPGGNSGWTYHAPGWYNTNSWTAYTGTVYTRETRLDATKAALKALVNALLANNKPEGTVGEDGVTRLDDIIEITLIKFAYAQEETGNNYYNGTSTLIRNVNLPSEHAQMDTIIDNLRAGGGTNWERALNEALTEANKYKTAQPTESTSVIFLTDGVPTSWGTDNSHPGYENRDNTHNSWNEADDDARAIITAGHTLYNIFTFGTDTQKYNNDDGRTDADYLRALTNYAYTGTGTYANTAATQYVRDYFFNAKDTTALTEAFKKIISNLTDEVGYGGVDYEDGVTVGVTNTSVTVEGSVHEGSFRYTVRNGNNIIYTVKIENGTATFSINGENYTDDTPETVITKIDPDDQSTWIESIVYSVDVDGKTYAMSPATINKDTGLVDWDLAGLGILENGYTYTVAFDVWPNQFSYDLVADLNNGVKTLAQIKQELIDEYGETEGTRRYDQIVAALVGPDANGQYSILTNWKQVVNYYSVETETDDQGHETTTYTQQPAKELQNPDPVALTSKPLPMTKVWNSNLSPDQIGSLLYSDYPTNQVPTKYRVTLHLWKADTAAALQNLIDQYSGDPTTASEHDYIEKTLGWSENASAYVWSDSVAIAPGTMVSLQTAADMGIDTTSSEHQKNIVTYEGQQYYIVESGHYYYVTEDNIDWHFELETVIYHPMMVNGKLKNVTFNTDADGNITGVEDIEDMTEVTATNSKTAELDITKKIVDNTDTMTQAQMDAETFTYKITLTVPADADMSHTNALEWVPRYNDDVSASNRYYIYGYQRSEDETLLGFDDDVTRFNGKVYGQYTVSYQGGGATLDEIFTLDEGGATMSGTIYATLKQNEVIRFTNLPAGTQYWIEEMYNNLYQADPSRDADANLGENAPASNVEANGYTVTIKTKNGSPTVAGRVVFGTINELNKRYYNQFTNTLKDTAVVDLDVTKHLQGYEWSGERYYMKLAAEDENTPLPRITTRYLSAASGSDDVTFNFGNVHLEPGTYTYTITETASNFTDVYSGKVVNGVAYDAVKTIIVTVSDDLSVSIAEGSSDGVTYDSETNTVKTKVTNRVLPLSIYKIGGADVDNKLEGVEFKLYSDADLTTQLTEDARGNAIGTDGLITTGSDGTATIGVLNTGTYYLVETGLGNNGGYNMLTDAVEITIGDTIHYKQTAYAPSEMYSSGSREADLVKENGGMYINYAEDGKTIAGYTFTINNNTGVELPMTGGIGTLPYTLGGLALALCALVFLLETRRRQRRRGDATQ